MKKTDELFKKADALYDEINSSKINCVDPASISHIAKTPYKILCLREALLWRSEEISRNCISLLRSGDIVTAAVLSRCLTENSAVCWYAMELILDRNSGKRINDFDEFSMRLLMGHKTWEEMPDPVNIMTQIDKADKTVSGLRANYDRLSELTHPNYMGTSFMFSQIDRNKILTNFSRYPRNKNKFVKSVLASHNGSLAMLKHSYNRITDYLPKLISICEEEIRVENEGK